jgi:DNA-binding CsgD family transcriptional regulator
MTELTDQQCGIAQCVFCGMSNIQIAEFYRLSVQTIKNHITIVMGKIGVRDRLGIVLWWWRYAIDGKNEPIYKPDRRARSNQQGVQKRRAKEKGAPGRGITPQEWEDILIKYNYECLKCGSKEKVQMDHIVPISKGGAHDISNVQPLCKKCNVQKMTKTMDYRT